MKDWDEWRTRYQRWIRTMREPSKRLKSVPSVGLIVATPKTQIYLPAYTDGGWQDGKPVRASIGTNPVLIRIPALKIRERYLLLDGVHRLTDLKPAFVLIDYAEFTASDMTYWMDTFNVYWQRWAKSG